MKYRDIVAAVSHQLADEILTESEIIDYLDRVVDDINTQLNACFPTFTDIRSENSATTLEYNAIPDKYIRTVIIPGAAFKYYVTDEEGGYSAPKYEEDYKKGLFYMLRDYAMQIPEQYQAIDTQGMINITGSDAGLVVDPSFRGIM